MGWHYQYLTCLLYKLQMYLFNSSKGHTKKTIKNLTIKYMGNTTSIDDYNAKQNDLIQQINNTATDLADQYNTKFLDPKFCTTIALTYTEKLSNYKKHDLNGVALQLGVVADVPDMKEKLCELIVKHYTDRINLIAAIQHSIGFCSDRIFALASGPRCQGNPEVFDQSECTKSGGRWVPQLVTPDATIESNKPWFNYLKSMQDKYLDTLQHLLDILQQLKDHDETINDERLKAIGMEAERLIENMQQHCYQVYKLALTTPTYTAAELRAIQEEQNISRQEAAAREAALRAAQGLPPIQSN